MGSTDASDNNGVSNSLIRDRTVPKRGPGPPSTIVSNHIGWIEIMGLIQSPLHPGFTPKDDLINIPLLGTCCRGLQSLFVSRSVDEETRKLALQ